MTSPRQWPKTYGITGATVTTATNIFDPALKHFPRAFRVKDPLPTHPDMRKKYHIARRHVLDHLLRIIQASPFRENLVLRGSLLLKTWKGSAAREPGDLDWVVQPRTIKLEDDFAGQLFEHVVNACRRTSRAGSVELLSDQIAVDDIWSYERAPGRRLVLPWRVDDITAGNAQIDVVFGEPLPSPPIQTSIETEAGDTITLWTASREQSLAWKLMWLATDMHPQGKDLFDATLLAESATLSPDLLEETFRLSGMTLPAELLETWVRALDVDWENFKLEETWVRGPAGEWKTRLAEALGHSL